MPVNGKKRGKRTVARRAKALNTRKASGERARSLTVGRGPGTGRPLLARSVTLDQLLRGMTPADRQTEVDWGKCEGREAPF